MKLLAALFLASALRAQTWELQASNIRASLRGVSAVDASKYEVTTHEMWLAPPRSETIVGSAVETMVWSSAARSMPSMTPAKTSATSFFSPPVDSALTPPGHHGKGSGARGVKANG